MWTSKMLCKSVTCPVPLVCKGAREGKTRCPSISSWREKCPNESFVCHLTWLDQTGWEDVWYSACGDVEHAIWRHRGSVLPSVEMNGHQHNPLNAHVSSKWERRRDVAPLVWKNKSVWTRCCPDRHRRLRLITVGYPLVAAAWRRARGPPVASCCCGWAAAQANVV